MRWLSTVLTIGLAADAVVASTWFSKAGKLIHPVNSPGKIHGLNFQHHIVANSDDFHVAYNKWHETELERWLSDNEIPYPTPADRKDLENLIQKNWDSYAVSPYKNWDADQLSSYLKSKGVETKESAKSNKDALVSQMSSAWYETEDKAQTAWTNVHSWILDTWTDSSLKGFADKHGILGRFAISFSRFYCLLTCIYSPATSNP